jgi:hypothetical protein
MNARKAKSRIRAAEKIVAKWRAVLRIDPKWEIDVIISSPDDIISLASLDVYTAEYWKVKIELHPALLDLPDEADLKEKMDRTILHELLHLVMWQYSSFAINATSGKLSLELSKLEEQVIQHLETIIYSGKF